jgi:hypothetical protein
MMGGEPRLECRTEALVVQALEVAFLQVVHLPLEVRVYGLGLLLAVERQVLLQAERDRVLAPRA